MKIEYIREFLTLAEELNFTSAAEKRYITQPALSRHIAALEESLGTRLLDRTTHSISLTPAGNLAVEQFQRIIADYDKLVQNLALLNHGYNYELRIGSLGSLVDSYVEPVVEHLRTKYPMSKISMTLHEGQDLIQNLMDDKLDVGLLLRVRFPGDDRIRFHKVGHSRWMVMALEQDPLCAKDVISVRELHNRTFIYPEANNGFSDIANSMLAVHGVYPQNIVISEQEQTMRYTMKRFSTIDPRRSQMHELCPGRKFVSDGFY